MKLRYYGRSFASWSKFCRGSHLVKLFWLGLLVEFASERHERGGWHFIMLTLIPKRTSMAELLCWPPRGQQVLHKRSIWGIHCMDWARLWNPGQISPEVQNSGRTDVLQKLFLKKRVIWHMCMLKDFRKCVLTSAWKHWAKSACKTTLHKKMVLLTFNCMA